MGRSRGFVHLLKSGLVSDARDSKGSEVFNSLMSLRPALDVVKGATCLNPPRFIVRDSRSSLDNCYAVGLLCVGSGEGWSAFVGLAPEEPGGGVSMSIALPSLRLLMVE